ncbi:MAG: MotA/TolQ/ExbB proton channel family protein [Planctomycetes bacterium]|nr:MotA/TolQ/ExbB proton channel family protein [Planctomycetota bacterium]MBI3835133.1 MotA/TolQ/ExbB proton channel family protein [Planctomycetota bacterium]
MPKSLGARIAVMVAIVIALIALDSHLAALAADSPPGSAVSPTTALAAITVSAQPDSHPPEQTVMRAFDHYVVRGGWVTWLALIPLSVTALALIIDCGLTIRRASVMPAGTVKMLSDLLARGAYPEAVRLVADERSALARIIHSGMTEARNGYSAMERAMEDAVDEQAARFSRKIEYLNVIGNVAPMIGLFGTVGGIIRMFISIADAGGIPVMQRISSDLGTALVATYWGLLVAIPALSVFGLLRNRIDALLAECAVVADRMMSVFRGEVAESAAVTAEHKHATPTIPAVTPSIAAVAR